MSQEAPLPFHDDKLKRKEIAESFKQVLLNNNDSSVFTVNAPWGHGKTYFIDNLIGLIGDEAICIKYNAWECDYYDNPLIPLLCDFCNFITKCAHLYGGNVDFIKKNDFPFGLSSLINSNC